MAVDRVVRARINVGALALFGVVIVVAFAVTFGRNLVVDPRQDLYATLDHTSGLVPSHQVTLFGHRVGVVHDVELTPEGVRAHLKIEPDQPVPSRAVAQIIRRSAVGEHTLNLIPVSAAWTPPEDRLIPRLLEPATDWEAAEPGSELDLRAIAHPTDLHDLLTEGEELFRAIDLEDVGTTVRELAAAVGGRGETLVDLNRQAVDLNETLVTAIPDLERLIETSERPLEVLREHRDDLADMVTSVAELSDILARNRPTLEGLIDDGGATLRTLDGFVRDNRPNLVCAIDDLGDFTRVNADNLHWIARALDLNTTFWDSWDRVYQWDPYRPGINWFRVGNVVFEPETATTYAVRRPTPATEPGARCTSEFGLGVDAVRQAGHQPADPTSPGIDWAPLHAEASGGAAERSRVSGSPDRATTTPSTGGGAVPLALLGPAAALVLARFRRH